ncbi:MAG TPA: hypothetical protein VHE81_14830 [Lacipirellulaceae bacterium]|nr:hypothetical protein [Lacipirellulaceae bacterium]
MNSPAIRFHLVQFGFAFVVASACALFAPPPTLSAAPSSPRPSIGRIEIGIKNYFKVGAWTPIRIEADGIDGLEKPRVEVTVADSDGVPTTATAPFPAAHTVTDRREATVYTAVGRVSNPIRVSLFDGDKQLAERKLQPDAKAKLKSEFTALSATAEFMVSLGKSPFGVEEAFPDRAADSGQLARQVIRLDRVADLPTNWFGYEAVDVMLISVGDGDLCHELAADPARYEALSRWVELGGRLVVMCSGPAARQLFADGKPLVRFAPGKFAETVHLRPEEAGPLEHFAGTVTPIAKAPDSQIHIPRFTEIKGNIEAFAGRRPSDLPIVIRWPQGLGEVTFVGVDFSTPPLSGWAGRAAFLQALLNPYLSNTRPNDVSQRLVTRGYNDVAGALRQQLGRSFASVVPIGFGAVAGLTIIYLIFLGPLDYLLVNWGLRRLWTAWITFPLILLLFCAGAMSLADWRNGHAGPHANRLELVDVDTMSHRARGTFWATLFSPTARQFDVTLRGQREQIASAAGSDTLLSWWGLPGVGIGGMESGGIDLGIVQHGYAFGSEHKSLDDVPVLSSATKSFLGRWTAPDAPTIDAQLTDRDELAVGSITNRTGFTLRNVRLLYGTWAYRLGTINVGQQVNVDEQLSPRKAKTIVTHDVLDEANTSQGYEEGRFFDPEQATPREILNLMMFYQAAGGFGFAHLPNRYQAYCDLSRTLDLGRAILVADVDRPAVRLVDDATGKPIADTPSESTVVYRFVLPVSRNRGIVTSALPQKTTAKLPR